MVGTNQTPATASGRFVLRIGPNLHAALREAAAAEGISLNELCRRKLAAPDVTSAGPATVIVSRLLELFGESLLAAVAYGSWSRNELASTSDVDVLAVLDDGQRVTREVYRAWDALPPLQWEGRVVEPHFVHLPPADGPVTGSWAEAAVEGIVLYERGFDVSRRLVALRRRIADGALRRRWAHGQPYWVEAA